MVCTCVHSSYMESVWRMYECSTEIKVYLSYMGLASFPGSRVGEEEKEPGTHCSRMHQVPLVTCILLRYTKTNGNFCLPAERPQCKIILPVRHLWAVFKSETILLRH